MDDSLRSAVLDGYLWWALEAVARKPISYIPKSFGVGESTDCGSITLVGLPTRKER